MIRKVVFLAAFIIFLSLPAKALAGEGSFSLRSTTGEDYRCYAASLQMQDKRYTILVSCRDLIYPADAEIQSYIIWARPTDGSNAIKLGTLGFGRAQFRANKEFSSLFVTVEENQNAKSPSSQVVMRGNLETISFLQRPTTPTPTPEPGKQGEEGTKGKEEGKTPTSTLSTREKLVQALQRAGIAALFALVALIGLLFVITRSRG